MILATARQRLTRDDAQLAIRLLARGSHDEQQQLEHSLADQGVDALLDDPRLVSALRELPHASHASLNLFAYALIRAALRDVGEDDRGIADYVTSMVVHFSLNANVNRVSDHDDQTYSILADLLHDVNDPDARRAFMVRSHLGNYALWLSGMFPDYVEHRRWHRGGPDLEYVEDMGRTGFHLAADHRLAAEYGLTGVYSAAAEKFGRLRLALNHVSDSWLFPDVSTPERLMRQVRDDVHWRWVS